MPRVLVPLAEGFEELEAVAVVDVLRRAKIEVVTASLQPGAVMSSRQISILPDATIDSLTADDLT
jgi:4-methyl-5(b-hydroxyethyl)-thiazole monophosphate biosynthesis